MNRYVVSLIQTRTVYLSTLEGLDFIDKCTGKASCLVQGGWDDTNKASCYDPSLYNNQTNYMTMEYYCIPPSRIGTLCSSVNYTAENGEAWYVQTSGYPAEVPSSNANCSCSVDTLYCGTGIYIYTIDRMLQNPSASGQCKQSVTLTDGDVSNTLTCDDNVDLKITRTSNTNHYLKFEFHNSMTSQTGRLWMGFSVSDKSSDLQIRCPAQARRDCIRTITTATTTTSMTPSATATIARPSTSATNDKLPLIIAVSVGGVILLAVIIVIAIICYKKRGVKENDENDENDTESQVDNRDESAVIGLLGPGENKELTSVPPANTAFLPPISVLNRRQWQAKSELSGSHGGESAINFGGKEVILSVATNSPGRATETQLAPLPPVEAPTYGQDLLVENKNFKRTTAQPISADKDGPAILTKANASLPPVIGIAYNTEIGEKVNKRKKKKKHRRKHDEGKEQLDVLLQNDDSDPMIHPVAETTIMAGEHEEPEKERKKKKHRKHKQRKSHEQIINQEITERTKDTETGVGDSKTMQDHRLPPLPFHAGNKVAPMETVSETGQL